MTSLRDDADPSYEVVDLSAEPTQPRTHYVVRYRAGTGLVGLRLADEPLGPAVMVPADWAHAQLVDSDAVTLLDLTRAGVLLVDGERRRGATTGSHPGAPVGQPAPRQHPHPRPTDLPSTSWLIWPQTRLAACRVIRSLRPVPRR